MSLKKILFITTVPQMMAQFLLPFANHFRKKGVRVDAMAADMNNFSDLKNHFDYCWDVEFSRQPLNLKNLLQAPKTIRRIVQEQQYQIVHVHSPIAAFITRMALRKMKSPRPKIIYTAHGFHFYQGGNPMTNMIYRTLEKIAARWTDHLIVMNEEDKKAVQKFKLTSEQWHYMDGIGIPVEKYQQTSGDLEKLRQEFNFQEQDQFFLMVAEFTAQKNHQLVIEAFSQLQNPDLYLLLAGVGAELEKMKALVKKKNLEKKVIFLGYRSDIPLLLHAALAVILVSKREGLPRSILEAMCAAKPVIGTDIRGIRDLLADGVGILIREDNQNDLLAAMQFVLKNPDETVVMAKKAVHKIERYELSKIIDLHEKLYEKALP
jgi:glycosyltransferase involved in cell wall biosynthesis